MNPSVGQMLGLIRREIKNVLSQSIFTFYFRNPCEGDWSKSIKVYLGFSTYFLLLEILWIIQDQHRVGSYRKLLPNKNQKVKGLVQFT